MDPIGASNTWRYHGYNNSTVMIKGQPCNPSARHALGRGLWISARDEARFGYLFLREGKWKNKQIISKLWSRRNFTYNHCPDYGYLWWLNTAHKQWPSAPASSFAALGYGSNIIWVDPEHDLVCRMALV
jgi:CubicO group peptidase (beta-lactamase class C family)